MSRRGRSSAGVRCPALADEVERVRANAGRPSARGVLLDALSARRDDGVDWSARLRAATQLLALEDEDPAAAEPKSVIYVPRDHG